MISPQRTGHVPFVPSPPSWAGGTSASRVAGISGPSGVTISDQHFDGLVNEAIDLRDYTNLTIERCTFSNIAPGQTVDRAIALQICNTVTIRDCAFYNCPGGAVLLNTCDTVTIEDCWMLNDDPGVEVGDIINAYLSQNVTVRRCRLFGGGSLSYTSGILLGDGADAVNGGGGGHVAEDNVLIDCNLALIGTNGSARRNVVLNRGLAPAKDSIGGGIFASRSSSYPTNPAGPFTVENNDVQWFRTDGQLAGPVTYDQAVAPVAGIHTNPVGAVVDEFTRWTPHGYYAYP